MPATTAAGRRPRHMPGIALKVADGRMVPWRIHVRARMDHAAVAVAIRVNVTAHLRDRPVMVVRPCRAMVNRTATGVAAMPVAVRPATGSWSLRDVFTNFRFDGYLKHRCHPIQVLLLLSPIHAENLFCVDDNLQLKTKEYYDIKYN